MKYETAFLINDRKIIEFDKNIEYNVGDKIKMNGENYEIYKVISTVEKEVVKKEYHLRLSLGWFDFQSSCIASGKISYNAINNQI